VTIALSSTACAHNPCVCKTAVLAQLDFTNHHDVSTYMGKVSIVRDACRTAINLTVAAGVVLIARYLPYLSTVMSLVGAFMTITISVIFPAAASFKLHKHEMATKEKAWDIFVIVVGLVCTISGTAAAIISLKAKMGF
jgi:amino acid permease